MHIFSQEEIDKIVEYLKSGNPLPEDYKAILFENKKEYELIYDGKEREEDILADTMAVPLQPVKTFLMEEIKIGKICLFLAIIFKF
ncbi:MAG TPA: hypothetical protein PLC16_08750 [Defluviitaleaceae bacterium]|nr:hypothetical protein [Defluviitaleaceae bacterium]